MNNLLEILQEYHFVRVQLIGCMDMEQRMLLRQEKHELERKLSELRHHTSSPGGHAAGDEYPGGPQQPEDPPGIEAWESALSLFAPA